jgi:hypothetical protein
MSSTLYCRHNIGRRVWRPDQRVVQITSLDDDAVLLRKQAVLVTEAAVARRLLALVLVLVGHTRAAAVKVAAGAFAVLTLDGAGWHQKGDRLVVPDDTGLLHLPLYSPELDPAENIRQFLRQNDLSNRVFATHETIVEACDVARNKLVAAPERIRSIVTRDHVKWSAHKSFGTNPQACA